MNDIVKLKPRESFKYKTQLTYLLLILYGCVFSYILVKTTRMAHPLGYLEDYYMSLRVEWLDLFMNEMRKTGLYTGLHRLYDHNASMYFYLSHLGVFAGFDTMYTFFYTQLVMVWSCIALFPSIFYKITGNVYVSILSILFFKLYNPFSLYLLSDSYWIGGWTTYISLPILYFLFRDKWKKSNWIWITLLLGVIGVGNVFRANAGLAVIISLIILMVVKLIYPAIKEKNIKPVIIGLCICFLTVFANGFFTSTIPNIYQSATHQPESLPIKGPWHSMYIGLGWEENPLGLEYADGYGYIDREDLLYNVKEGYYIGIESPAYIKAVKKAYFNAIASHPAFFIGSYIKKGFTALFNSVKFSVINIFLNDGRYYYVKLTSHIITILLAVFMVMHIKRLPAGIRKSSIRRFLMFLPIPLIFIICGIIPGVIATPIVREYLFGAVSTFDCIALYAYITALIQATKFIKTKLNKSK